MQYNVQDKTKFVEMFGFKILSWIYFIYLLFKKISCQPSQSVILSRMLEVDLW